MKRFSLFDLFSLALTHRFASFFHVNASAVFFSS